MWKNGRLTWLNTSLLGYGGTDKPLDPAEYIGRKMAQDAVDIVNHENVQNVVAVGHDWFVILRLCQRSIHQLTLMCVNCRGAFLVSRLAYYHQERFLGFAFLAAPYMPVTGTEFNVEAVNTQLEQMFGYRPYGYQEFLCEDGAAAILKEHVRRFLFFVKDATSM